MPYRSLDAEKIEQTIDTLHRRIGERFPGRGLVRLCAELLAVAREDRERLSWQTRPNLLVRIGVGLTLALGTTGLVLSVMSLPTMAIDTEAINVIQGIEAVLNVVVLAGAAIWFLLNLESNMRRSRVLADLHELRSIAHVVDMHQLTKDPTTLAQNYTGTASSETSQLTRFELVRYLDYCTEMLALTGKLAALYMQNVRDPVIIQTVNEIEDLTGNLSRKIWQKIMILNQSTATAP